MDHVQWRSGYAPDRDATTLKLVQGNGEVFRDLNITANLFVMQAGESQLFAGIDVTPNQTSEYVKLQLRYTITCVSVSYPTGTWALTLSLRCWTDENTYTDVTISTPQTIDIVAYQATTAISLFLCNGTYNNASMIMTGFWDKYGSENPDYRLNAWACSFLTFSGLVQGNLDETAYSPEFGPASEPEGYTGGSFDDHSDPVDFPTDPQSIVGLGFVNVYKCAANSLIDFGAALFPKIQFPQSLSDVGEVIAAVSDSIWNAKLIDYVVSVHCVPGDVTGGALEDIKVGARTMTGILARKVSSEYVTINFGSISTNRIFRNYADVMTGCKIFLPFYGYVDLAPEYWNGCTLELKYKVNVIDGSFMAYLKASDCYYSKLNGIIGQYGGTACVHIPTTGGNYASLFSTLVGAGSAAAMGVASGNLLGAASNLMEVGTSIAGGGNIQSGGSYNASASFMSMRQPFLQIEIPVPSFSEKYNRERGLPSNVMFRLGSLQGFTKCDAPEITFACTDEEAEEIKGLLQSGVIL